MTWFEDSIKKHMLGLRGRGTRGPDKAIGFLINTSQDPMENLKAIKPAIKVGTSSARQLVDR